MQKYYLSISEFSRMTGIPRKTLIYYDKIGLVKPALIQENGYRRYTAQQANTVSVIQGLRLLNMPLEEIRRYLDERTPASSLELFKRQATQIQEQIDRLEQIHAMLECRIRTTMLGINLNERGVMLLHQKAAPIVKSKAIEGYGHYSITDKWDDVFQQLTQYGVAWGAPVGMIIPLNSFLARRFDGITCHYYIECPDCAQTFEQRPAGLYAIIRDYANYGEAKPIYGRLLDFITEQHMRPCSDAYEHYLLDEVCCRDPKQYLVQIAVRVEPELN